MVEIENLTRRFGKIAAVDGVSLNIARGEVVALWGPNGAGKTTILRCLLGLMSYDGRLSLDGIDLAKEGPRARARLGYVPQELRFHDDLTVAETAALYASLRGLPSSSAAPQLERVGLVPHLKKKIGELSGGLKQRLALALALLDDPPVLLLDEPTSNLDLAGREEFLELLRGLKAQGKTMLFSAHHVDEVAPIAERVVLLEQGRVVRDCPPVELQRLLSRKQPALGGTKDTPPGSAHRR